MIFYLFLFQLKLIIYKATKVYFLRLNTVNNKIIMKRLLCFIPLLFIFGLVKAQVYNIDQVNGQTISTCTGDFNDSGGHIEHC